MKRNFKFIICSLVGLSMLAIACNHSSNKSKPLPTYSCGWDHVISTALGDTAAKAWRGKWDYKQQSGGADIFVPDSFYVGKRALKKLVGNSCGFYASYGLTDTNNMSTMCITLSPIDHNQDSVLFIDATSVIPNSSTGQPDQNAKYISKKEANKYHRLWEIYNGICMKGDTLGNTKCEKLFLPGEIPPGGKLGEGITGKLIDQIVPISQAYDSEIIFHVLDSVYQDKFDGIYFVCALFPTEFPKNVSEVNRQDASAFFTLQYDFVLKADVVINGTHTSKAFPTKKNNNGDDVELDRSCPCPGNPCCDQS